MDFSKRLASLRKHKGLNQSRLADALGVHVSQVKRYEGGNSQPTLPILKKMAVTLGVSADTLLFGEDERAPSAALRLQFEAIERMDDAEKSVVMAVLDGLILRHQAKQWTKNRDSVAVG